MDVADAQDYVLSGGGVVVVVVVFCFFYIERVPAKGKKSNLKKLPVHEMAYTHQILCTKRNTKEEQTSVDFFNLTRL